MGPAGIAQRREESRENSNREHMEGSERCWCRDAVVLEGRARRCARAPWRARMELPGGCGRTPGKLTRPQSWARAAVAERHGLVASPRAVCSHGSRAGMGIGGSAGASLLGLQTAAFSLHPHAVFPRRASLGSRVLPKFPLLVRTSVRLD